MKGLLDFFAGIVGQTIFVLVLIGALAGLAVGAALVFDSPRALRWNERLSRWISTREATQRLDTPHDVKRFVYRAHRIAGLLVVAGALFALDALSFEFQARDLARAFRDLGNLGLLEVGFVSLRVFLLLGNLAALGAGLVLCFRPSLLKGIEQWADRSYTTRASSKVLDAMHFQPDRWVGRHPRLAGGIILAGSAYILISLAFLPLL